MQAVAAGMRDRAALQRRYQQDEPAVRLGGLASNLSRIAWYAQRENRDATVPLFRESKYFTEWAAPSCALDQQLLLAELQLQLARWERGWGHRISASTIAGEAQAWSARLLASSGLER